MAEGFRDDLKRNINGILPHLSEEKTDNLIDFLFGKGVKKELDLRRITIPVLEDHLRDLIDASDLYDEWQRRYVPGPSQATPMTTSNSSRGPLPTQNTAQAQSTNSRTPLTTIQQNDASGSGSSTGTVTGRIPLAERLRTDQMPKYDKTSHVIPLSVKEAIEKEQRAPSSGRVQMVDRIVDHCRQTVPNLQRGMFNVVALRLVEAYPKTFKDTVQVSDHGSDSLAKQMRDKFDNDKRPRNAASTKEKEAPCCKEAYGCAKWNPPIPEGESEAIQEDKRLALKTIHSLSQKEWEWKLIKTNMEETYFLQRKDINGKLAETVDTGSKKRKRTVVEEEDLDNDSSEKILSIKDRWPFLFTSRGINYHFRILTGGIDFRDNLFQFMQEEGNLYIEFLASKGPELTKVKMDMVRAERNGQSPSSTKLPTVLQMLAKALKDNFSYFVRYVESTTSFEEVSATVNFPTEGTPLIVAAGSNLYDAKKFYLCIDNCPVTTVSTVSEAYSMLFSSYFVFNIEYATALSGLLNFSQRIIAKIAPQKGGKGKTAAIDKLARDRVCKLNNKYEEYKQHIDAVEN